MYQTTTQLTAAATTVGLAVASYVCFRRVKRALVGDLSKKAVFITGCDTGFGHALACRLDALGVPVFAGCLTEDGARNLQEKTSGTLRTVLINVGDHESVQKAYECVVDGLSGDTDLWGVVNNAGIPGLNGPLDFMNLAAFQTNYRINFLGLCDVTQTFLPFITRSRGRIVNTSSASVVVSFPGMYPYLTSKAAVRAFTTALRLERKPYGIKVCCVLPGFYMTPISDLEKYERQVRGNWENLPEEVRQHYGEEYVNETISKMVSFTKSSADPDLTAVIDAYTHALFAVYPRDEYFPGAESIVWVLSLTPWFVARCLTEWMTNMSLVVPRALRERV